MPLPTMDAPLQGLSVNVLAERMLSVLTAVPT